MTPDLPHHATSSGKSSPSGDVFGLTVPTANGFECYCIAQDDDGPIGEPRLLHRSDTLAYGPAFSRDGQLAVWSVARPGKHAFGLIAFDLCTGERIAELWEGADAGVTPASFSPVSGDSRLLAATDASGVKRPIMWDTRRNVRVDLHVGDLDGEVTPWEWTPDGEGILLCQFSHAAQRLWLFDIGSGALRRLAHPEGTLANPPQFLADGTIAVRWMDSTHPRSVIVLDGQTGRQVGTLLEPPAVPEGRPWRSVTFPSDGGMEIQAWLATPEGPGPFPTIIHTHGGPTSVQLNTFEPASQMWLDHGFAWCSVNYRGSTTCGRDFERAIWGNLGHWEVRDMVAARRYLLNSGIADPRAIFLTGWSYGGYLTLQALGLEPDLWAGGMGGVVVADWVSQYEDENEVLRGYDTALFGGALEERRYQYVKSSPMWIVCRRLC